MIESEVKEYIRCPQFGDNYYGKWGCLNLEQRRKIKQLLDKIDNLKIIENKYNQLQSNWNSLREWLKNKIDNFQDDVSEPILHEQMTMRVIYEHMENLDKMNELEGVDNENN